MTSPQHSGGGNTKGRKASFGSVRKLPSGRWQARYTGPDSREHKAPTTFATKGDAQTWLSMQRADITRSTWLPDATRDSSPTLAMLAEQWLAMPRTKPLKPRTASHYRSLLNRFILPDLGDLKVRRITTETVERWYYALPEDRPTYRAHAYSLLRTILGYAVTKKFTPANPATIAGAGTARRHRRIEPATVEELATIIEHMPQRYRPMVLLAAWCALRFGELTELRRKDIDLAQGVVDVARAVVHVDGGAVVGSPKSAAGVRTVAIPPHLLPVLAEHLDTLPRSHEALLFPSATNDDMHLKQSSLAKVFYPARAAAGRKDLRFHDLRHTGAVFAAMTGATLAELMGRLGHSTPRAALIYQHRARGRDAEIAAALSRLASGST